MTEKKDSGFDLESMSRYQMRHVAGIYWLLDMSQPGYPYKKPVPLNEQGARIWEMTGRGMDIGEISAELGEWYGVSPDEIKSDIREFYEQLGQQGILK